MYTFVITAIIIGMISLSSNDNDDDPKGFNLTARLFSTEKVFNISAYIICLLLALLYSLFW